MTPIPGTMKERGNVGETAAAKYLTQKGFRVRARNVHLSHYEIDIIAENRDYIVFAEVKSRTVPYLTKYGETPFAITPAMAVTKDKQRKLITAARMYLGRYPSDKQPRLDVIEVYLQEDFNRFRVLKIHHIENAFGASR